MCPATAQRADYKNDLIEKVVKDRELEGKERIWGRRGMKDGGKHWERLGTEVTTLGAASVPPGRGKSDSHNGSEQYRLSTNIVPDLRG
jgi:hypothetical protein